MMNTLKDYEKVHRHPVNIAIHVFTVPFFVGGTLNALLSLAYGNMGHALAGFLLAFLALALQRFGHNLEAHQPAPFANLFDGIKRILAEQLYRFWLFLVLNIQGVF